MDPLVYKHVLLPDVMVLSLGGNHLHFLPAVLALKFAFQQANRLQPFKKKMVSLTYTFLNSFLSSEAIDQADRVSSNRWSYLDLPENPKIEN